MHNVDMLVAALTEVQYYVLCLFVSLPESQTPPEDNLKDLKT